MPKEPENFLRGEGCSVAEGKPVNEYGLSWLHLCLQHSLPQSWEIKAGHWTGEIEQYSSLTVTVSLL